MASIQPICATVQGQSANSFILIMHAVDVALQLETWQFPFIA